MKNFKEMLDKDLNTTFYRTEEFARIKRVRCDGIDKKIPVVFDSEKTEGRKTLLSGDHAEGIYGRYIVIRVRLSDMGKEPRQGARFWLENDLFKITDVQDEYNELIIGLERFDE